MGDLVEAGCVTCSHALYLHGANLCLWGDCQCGWAPGRKLIYGSIVRHSMEDGGYV